MGNSKRDETMDVYCYFRIDGEMFDPEAFQATLDSARLGEVKTWKKIVKGETVIAGSYWASSEHKVENHIKAEEKIVELLRTYETELVGLKENDAQVMVHIVSRCYEEKNVSGYFLNKETIALLSKVGASIDIDQY